jgi:uncharacterized protein (TIGR00106 family)
MLASFSIVPIGVGEELVSPVAEIINIVDQSGMPYRLGAMQTTVEGEPEAVMALIMKCHEAMKGQASRVLTSITIDDRQGAAGRLMGKVKDVEAALGRELSRE